MKRKRKPYFPPSRGPAPAPAGGSAGARPTTVVAIDLTAGLGRDDIVTGSRVTIGGTGLYAGQVGVVERLIAGVIPAALVRVDGGGSRRVRTVDLEPIRVGRPQTGARSQTKPATGESARTEPPENPKRVS